MGNLKVKVDLGMGVSGRCVPIWKRPRAQQLALFLFTSRFSYVNTHLAGAYVISLLHTNQEPRKTSTESAQ